MASVKGVNIHIETPECDRLLKVKDASQTIGEFLEWYRGQDRIVHRQTIENVLAKYFDIDMAKVERERRAILSGIRAANEVRA